MKLFCMILNTKWWVRVIIHLSTINTKSDANVNSGLNKNVSILSSVITNAPQ